MKRCCLCCVLLALLIAPYCFAQDTSSPKFTIFGGPAAVASRIGTQGGVHFGMDFDAAPPGSWAGFLLEGAYAGPVNSFSAGSAVFSANYMTSWAPGYNKHTNFDANLLPFATVGYSRLFGTGNAINFGGGLDYRYKQTRAVRVEVRDYLTFVTPRQHNVGLRVGWIFYISD